MHACVCVSVRPLELVIGICSNSKCDCGTRFEERLVVGGVGQCVCVYVND